MFSAHVSVRQELVDPRYRVAIGEAVERRGQAGVRVDASELAVLDERGDHRPVVEIFAAIVKEPGEAVPARRRVADRIVQTALGADLPASCFEEPLEVVDNGAAALVADAATLICS